jgi:hypothetical protein
VAACDSQPLKACLERNNNDRSKCLAEWEAFKRACAAPKSSAAPFHPTSELPRDH